jgi:hypothetical protein
MKTGYCLNCRKYQRCVIVCNRVEAELARATKGRRKQRINLVYEYELGKNAHRYFVNVVYGAPDDPIEAG